jgi:hypothetical protein
LEKTSHKTQNKYGQKKKQIRVKISLQGYDPGSKCSEPTEMISFFKNRDGKFSKQIHHKTKRNKVKKKKIKDDESIDTILNSQEEK